VHGDDRNDDDHDHERTADECGHGSDDQHEPDGTNARQRAEVARSQKSEVRSQRPDVRGR
jgi:hypothetical protein